MNAVKKSYVQRALAVAIMTGCASFSVQAGFSSDNSIDRDVLHQVMALHGLDEQAAIDRLAAEEAATDLYQDVRSMSLSGYAGAWFDAETGLLHVASNNPGEAGIITRLGAKVVSVMWSLKELETAQNTLLQDMALQQSNQLQSVHIDYMRNRVIVAVRQGQISAVRARLSQSVLAAETMGMIELKESGTAPLELTVQFRGADGTRNQTFEQHPSGTGYYPCSIGATTTNGFYTAGHCGMVDDVIKYAATNTRMGVTKGSSLPYQMASLGDIGWVRRDSNWIPIPKINGYTNGIIDVPAKWSGTAEAPIGATVCRYGQISGGPHCGVINAKNLNPYFDEIGTIKGVTEVNGSCSSDGDSGGTWVLAGVNQIQGTTIGRTVGNTCNNPSPPANRKTYFQPISDHINAYASAAGSLLTAHGANPPTVENFQCPHTGMSGGNTYWCSYDHYNAQGKVSINWQAPSVFSSSGTNVNGSCSPGAMVYVQLNINSPHGMLQKNASFPCPSYPIP